MVHKAAAQALGLGVEKLQAHPSLSVTTYPYFPFIIDGSLSNKADYPTTPSSIPYSYIFWTSAWTLAHTPKVLQMIPLLFQTLQCFAMLYLPNADFSPDPPPQPVSQAQQPATAPDTWLLAQRAQCEPERQGAPQQQAADLFKIGQKPYKDPHQRHDLGRMNFKCPSCGALHWAV
ncbi:hypothetical protein H0H93_014689 [Arthromyces matolae]|nr:hypothetical protein H0H93_014689 [Arthromyces matolae]